MKLKLGLLIMFLCGSLLLQAATPTVQKIGVVNVERIFNEYYKTKIVQSQLEEQQNVYRTHLATLNKQYVELQQQYNVLLDAAQNVTIKEAERQEKSREAAKKMAEIKNTEVAMNEYLTEKGRLFKELEDTKRTEITAEILGEIQRRATIEDFDVVLDYSGKTTSDFGSVVFFKNSLDITNKVLEELNRGNKAAIAEDTNNK